jgi:pimeloyl-ACP methyl ester carboxylesterase
MAPRLLLIHSPFLGPAVWRPTARVLERSGHGVGVPSLLGVARSTAPYWPAGVESVVRLAADEPVVLVVHSNAGLFVPAIAAVLGEQVRGAVFVDAALPGSGHYTKAEFLNRLAVVAGLLPTWTSWWDEAEVGRLFPDARTRVQVEAEQPRMPVAYYDHLPPAPPDWGPSRGGVIWFGRPYDSGALEAARRGWPHRHLPGGHLHMLTDPDAVAAAVLGMVNDWVDEDAGAEIANGRGHRREDRGGPGHAD